MSFVYIFLSIQLKSGVLLHVQTIESRGLSHDIVHLWCVWGHEELSRSTTSCRSLLQGHCYTQWGGGRGEGVECAGSWNNILFLLQLYRFTLKLYSVNYMSIMLNFTNYHHQALTNCNCHLSCLQCNYKLSARIVAVLRSASPQRANYSKLLN